MLQKSMDDLSLIGALQERLRASRIERDGIWQDGIAPLIQGWVKEELQSGKYTPSPQLVIEALTFLSETGEQANSGLGKKCQALQNGSLRPMDRGEIYQALGLSSQLRIMLESVNRGAMPARSSGLSQEEVAAPPPRPKPKTISTVQPTTPSKPVSRPIAKLPTRPTFVPPPQPPIRAADVSELPKPRRSTPSGWSHPDIIADPSNDVVIPASVDVMVPSGLVSDDLLRELGILKDDGTANLSMDPDIRRLQMDLWGIAKKGHMTGKKHVDDIVSQLRESGNSKGGGLEP